jgi:hypothetical protein
MSMSSSLVMFVYTYTGLKITLVNGHRVMSMSQPVPPGGRGRTRVVVGLTSATRWQGQNTSGGRGQPTSATRWQGQNTSGGRGRPVPPGGRGRTRVVVGPTSATRWQGQNTSGGRGRPVPPGGRGRTRMVVGADQCHPVAGAEHEWWSGPTSATRWQNTGVQMKVSNFFLADLLSSSICLTSRNNILT